MMMTCDSGAGPTSKVGRSGTVVVKFQTTSTPDESFQVQFSLQDATRLDQNGWTSARRSWQLKRCVPSGAAADPEIHD